MTLLLSKDESLKTTPVYIGFLVLKELSRKEEGKLSIFEIITRLRKLQGIVHYRQIILALMFLYTTGVIEFKEPYIIKI